MEAPLNLDQLLREAFAGGGLRLTVRTGRHPRGFSDRVVQAYDSQSSSSDEIDELLRQLSSSRELRELRDKGAIHFKSIFEDISLLGTAKTEGEDFHVELRKLSA